MRRRAGYTVAQLAERLSVTRATVYFWEQGRYLPNAGLLPELAEILGCTAAEVEPYVHLSILALNNYMIFNERALFLPQIEAAKKGLMQLAKRKG